MAKSKTVKTLTNKDKELLTQLYRTNLITSDQAHTYLNYSPDRLKQMLTARILTKEYVMIKKEFQYVYKLTDKGKDLVRSYNPKVCHAYHGASPTHDHKLTDLYYSQYFEHRDTWKTESDLNGYGRPDGSIEVNGQTIAIEVTTGHYTKEDVEAKHIFAEQHGMVVRVFGI